MKQSQKYPQPVRTRKLKLLDRNNINWFDISLATIATGFGETIKNITPTQLWQGMEYIAKPLTNALEFTASKLPLASVTKNVFNKFTKNATPLIALITLGKVANIFWNEYEEKGFAKTSTHAAGEAGKTIVENSSAIVGATAAATFATAVGAGALVTAALPVVGAFTAALIAERAINTISKKIGK